MRIALLLLAPALVLLWLPTALLIGHHRRRRLRNSECKSGATLPNLLRSPWTWVDFCRAALGAWLLANLAILPPTDPDSGTARILCMLLVLGVLFAGVVAQTLLTGSRHLRIAPLFYLVGLAAGVLPWQLSVFGGLLALTLTGMTGQWILAFWIMPLSLGAAAMLFRQLAPMNILMPALFLVPAILGIHPVHPLSWIYARARIPAADKPRQTRERASHQRTT
jgi:hypothetical protein